MPAPCAYICDFGERESFENSARAQGFLKIYDKIYSFWNELKRVDSMPYSGEKYNDFTRDTARISVFMNRPLNQIYVKFGCVFCLDTKKLFSSKDSEIRAGLEYFLNKFASKHFNKESLNMLLEAHLKAFNEIKSLYKTYKVA